MASQTPNVNHSWANPNPALSMDTVTINPSSAMSNLPRLNSSRQQQPTPGSGYNHCEGNVLPQLSMRDLQCLETVPQSQVMSQSESQQLFHMQQQRDELASDSRGQNQLGSQNQGLQTMWPNFDNSNPVQNTFNGSGGGGGGGGGSQGITSFPFLEGMDGSDFIKSLVTSGSQTGFQLKQEHQIPVGQESHTPLMQSPRETQGNTYTNLLPRPMSNGTKMDGSGNSQSLKNLQNPFSHNGMSSDGHYANLEDWIKTSRHSNYKE